MEGRSTKEFEDKADNKTDDSVTIQGYSTKEENSEANNGIISSFKSIFRKIFGQKNKEQFLESISQLVAVCAQKSFISSEEQKMINNIIKIDDIKVSDVMIPRTDIIAMSKKSTLEQIKDMIISKEHTRMPIYGENLDEVIGFIHSKDLVKFLSKEVQDFDINSLIRTIIYVPHSMRVVDLLRKMRSSRVHIAIVLDEYGGTDGLITIEDIMEEIVGEIEDEHDLPDDNIYNKIQKVGNNVFHIGGRVEIEEIEKLLSQKIMKDNSDDFETIGGFILSEMKKVPQVGEVLNFNANLSFKILEADLRSIKLIEVSKKENLAN